MKNSKSNFNKLAAAEAKRIRLEHEDHMNILYGNSYNARLIAAKIKRNNAKIEKLLKERYSM